MPQDYANLSEKQLEGQLESRIGEIPSEHHQLELRVFEEPDGSWTAGYFVPGEPESVVDPAGASLAKAEKAPDKRAAMMGMLQLLDLEKESKEYSRKKREGG